jgi:hypothetical protein
MPLRLIPPIRLSWLFLVEMRMLYTSRGIRNHRVVRPQS